MTNILHTFHDEDTNMTSFVVESFLGGYGVTVRDDDSGQFVSESTHGIKSIEDAVTLAKSVVC